ncbi:class II fructose-1,6-bisphosphate aldolase [Hydrogenibacillus schlegelii]|uniref:Class II fructose-1,6-bisphosphate aldolase n=1 Tax=Hydrogenibacillus schlegelii TaxID=1484 RepID=A0A132N919_HYDSH|nr:class II fructose-1,6-bisphosphate aldolase [Hydrogenibacillus schlegelii]KWX06619.1 tagatose-bisphosphate aldolase [Hydrogenibacillus schlegelii]MBT9282159.1 class II fructose-1,6-bisphosphate aldolase [Hydrogenibacillus schlegelii]OAR04190.1 tagatose-bisphosphate aldolase [Hydrogenibacillus schlegelii]PTQ54539.1 MAG: Fructose-bisphosphate aldolase class II [Hydrogenibacillus schlegelii]
MPLVAMTELMRRAKRERFAVGQFNMNNLEFVQAIMEAAELERAPLIFGVSEGALKYMGERYVVALARAAAEGSDIPVVLHLDHGSSFESVMRAIRAGFTSVMFDGSHLPFEENVRLTREIVRVAHAMGVSVEGEIGRIGGVEDDLSVEDEEAQITRPEEAIRFFEETGVDALAISVGTAHGIYKGRPKIRFHVIEAVARAIEAPIVLHGGSGVPEEDVRQAIALGVGKINVNTENQVAMTETIKRIFAEKPDVYDPRKYLGPARDAMREVVRAKMRLFGSSGKA